jgi:hypothetical protein
MKTGADTKVILDTVWRVFCRNSERLFEKECQQFWAQAFAGTEEAIQSQASREVEKSVVRLFDKTIRPLYSDLEQIANSQSDDPVEWALGETRRMVSKLLAKVSSGPADWFTELFQEECFNRLQGLVDEARIARAKMPAPPSPAPPWQSLPNYGELRRKIADILEKYGVELPSPQVITKLDSQAMRIVPDKSFKLPNGEPCMTFSIACAKSPKLSKRLHDNISTVRTALRKTRGRSQR